MDNLDDIFLNLLKEKVVPAVGCTEPIAVALAVAKAHETLGDFPAKVQINLSLNVLKNAMGVGIPGTNMVGLPVAAALGLVAGKSEDMLEVLKDVDEISIEKAKNIIIQKIINFDQKNIDEKLYIEVICHKNESYSKVVIAHTHTNFVLIEKDGIELLKKNHNSLNNTQTLSSNTLKNITISAIYDFAVNCKLDKIAFIMQSAIANKKAAEIGMKHNYGMQLNKIFKLNIEHGILRDDALSYALSLTTAAIDARMGGAKVTVYSNSGSGDQGIAITLPVLAFAENTKTNEEKLIRALVISHLIAIYIKQKLGILSPFCGITTASMGAACGITYLMGGGETQIEFAIKNFAASIVGMICDGAKNSCSMKVSAGVFCAFEAAMLAMESIYPNCTEGIVHSSVEQTIENVVNIGKIGMKDLDSIILNMLLNK